MQKGSLSLQVTSGGLAPNTLSQSQTSGQQDGVAGPKANALVSISETDVTQADKQYPVSIIQNMHQYRVSLLHGMPHCKVKSCIQARHQIS
jgi:hypothetical protein